MSGLPESWVATTLEQVVSYADNETIDPADMPPDAWLLELEDIERDTGKVLERKTVSERAPKSSKNRFHAGDVLYGKLRPYLNKVVRADQNGLCSSEIIAISPGILDMDYLFYSLRSPGFIEYVSNVSHGMRMPRLGTQQAKSAPFALPPLAEQTRIAAKLDELLAQVDTLKARIDGIPALLKRFRQSVLAAAVSGRLTEEWRQHASIEGAPRKAQLGALIKEMRNGLSAKPNEDGKGLPILRISSVRARSVDQTDIRFLECDENEKERYTLRAGDLLFTRYNGSLELVGVCGLVRKLTHAALVYPDKLIRARCNTELVQPEYLEIFFSESSARRQVMDLVKSTSGQKGISGQDLKAMYVTYPSLLEQTEIVRRVERLFAFADQLEAHIKAAQTRIDRLTQSILAKAFRGELVPQDPNDEPASVLLERIKAQRAAAPKTKRGRKASA